MARTLRRLLAATSLSASLVAGAAPAVAAPPPAPAAAAGFCIEIWVIQIGDVVIIVVQCTPVA